MICLAYLSTARRPPEAAELEAILEKSRRNNAAAGVTGMLCHYDGSFLQFLEGEPEAVSTVYSRICADRRHYGIVEVYRGAIEGRIFSDWTMGLARTDQVGPEQRAFCQSLMTLEINAAVAHKDVVEPFINAFRSWIH